MSDTMPTLSFAVIEPPSLWPILPPLLAGALAIYLLLPRPRPLPRVLGAAVGALALLLAGALLVEFGAFTLPALLFYAFAGIALLAGGLLVTQHNPAYAALAFALVVLSSCGLFLLQAAPFLMASTIVIYAGAIIVTFLFVLMLAQRTGPSDADDRSREPLLASVAGFVLLGALLAVVKLSYQAPDLDKVLSQYQERARTAAEKDSADEMVDALGDKYFTELEDDLHKLLKKKKDDDNDEFGDSPDKSSKKKKEEDRDDLDDEEAGPALEAAKALHTRINADEYAPKKEWNTARDQPGGKGIAAMRKALEQVQKDLLRVHALIGSQPPPSRLGPPGKPPPSEPGTEGEGPPLPLSSFSGPPPNGAVAWTADGEAPLPAENVASLGRTLFTDFLLAIELAGTLLLIATIGAIIIAVRGGERTA